VKKIREVNNFVRVYILKSCHNICNFRADDTCSMLVCLPDAVELFKNCDFLVNPRPIDGFDRYQWLVKCVSCKWLDWRANHVGYFIQFKGFEYEYL